MQDDATTFIPEEEGEVLGFCNVGSVRDNDQGFGEEVGEIRAINIHPDQQGKGIGGRLMDSGLDFLREKGYKKAILWVLASNESSINFYKHKGWEANGKEKIVKIGKEKEIEFHEVCFEKRL